MNLVKRWAILALAFWLTTFIVSGIEIEDGAWNYFWVAALFGVVNTLLGGLLKLFTLPAVIITFGLFVFVINAAMLTLVCLLYTSPSPRDATLSRMPSSA